MQKLTKVLGPTPLQRKAYAVPVLSLAPPPPHTHTSKNTPPVHPSTHTCPVTTCNALNDID